MPTLVRVWNHIVGLIRGSGDGGDEADPNKSWFAHETGGTAEATWAEYEGGGASPTTWADLET